MRFQRVWSVALISTSACLAAAQSTTTVAASAGSVAGQAVGGSWQGLPGSAATASIQYQVAGVGQVGNELKFKTSGSSIEEKTFDGYQGTTAEGSVSFKGESVIYTPPPSSVAPTYYTAEFTSKVTTNVANGNTDSGTYDPWDVHYKDVADLGVIPGGFADLYYQSSLVANSRGRTGFSLGPNATGAYNFSISLSTPSGYKATILDIVVTSTGMRTIQIGTNPQLELYLLGNNATDPSASPSQRYMATDAVKLVPGSESLITSYFRPDGSLYRDIDFGVRYKNFQLPTTGSPDDVLFSWHTDTTSKIQAVPEPSSMIAAGLGLAAFCRRRKRRA